MIVGGKVIQHKTTTWMEKLNSDTSIFWVARNLHKDPYSRYLIFFSDFKHIKDLLEGRIPDVYHPHPHPPAPSPRCDPHDDSTPGQLPRPESEFFLFRSIGNQNQKNIRYRKGMGNRYIYICTN